jgi:hypothetical protein
MVNTDSGGTPGIGSTKNRMEIFLEFLDYLGLLADCYATLRDFIEKFDQFFTHVALVRMYNAGLRFALFLLLLLWRR